jgi:hypothetical protein
MDEGIRAFLSRLVRAHLLSAVQCSEVKRRQDELQTSSTGCLASLFYSRGCTATVFLANLNSDLGHGAERKESLTDRLGSILKQEGNIVQLTGLIIRLKLEFSHGFLPTS